jgi:hypothetical protein
VKLAFADTLLRRLPASPAQVHLLARVVFYVRSHCPAPDRYLFQRWPNGDGIFSAYQYREYRGGQPDIEFEFLVSHASGLHHTRRRFGGIRQYLQRCRWRGGERSNATQGSSGISDACRNERHLYNHYRRDGELDSRLYQLGCAPRLRRGRYSDYASFSIRRNGVRKNIFKYKVSIDVDRIERPHKGGRPKN